MTSNSGRNAFQPSKLSVITEATEPSSSSGSPRRDTPSPSSAVTYIEDEPTPDPPKWAEPYNAVPSDDKCSIWKLHFSCEDCMYPPPQNSCLHQRHFDDLPVYGIWQCSGARQDHYKRIAYLNHLLSQSRLDGPDKAQAPEHVRNMDTPPTFEHPMRVVDEHSRYSSSFVEWPEPALNSAGLAMKQCKRCSQVPSPFRGGEIPWLHINMYGCRDSGTQRSAQMLEGSASDVFRRDNLVAQGREVLGHFHMDRLLGPGGKQYVAKETMHCHWVHLNIFKEEVLKHAKTMHDAVEPWRRCAGMGREHVKLETVNQRSCCRDGWFVPGVPRPPPATEMTGQMPVVHRPGPGERERARKNKEKDARGGGSRSGSSSGSGSRR